MRFALLFTVGMTMFCGCRKAAERSATQEAQQKTPDETPAKTKHAELVSAPAGEEPVDALVKRELARAANDQRRLVVYVGASWCEPCTRFHDAVAQGKMDKHFPDLRLLEFDRDRNEERLEAAGYTSRLIPLFVVPRADGRASERFMQGGIKGDGAVANIVPRLKRLLAH